MSTAHRIKWKKSDHAKAIVAFTVNALLLIAFMLVALIFKVNGIEPALAFAKSNVKMFGFIFLAVILLFVATYAFYYSQYRDLMHKTRNIYMLSGVLIISIIASYAFGKISVYLRPFALCALLALLLSDKRSAIFLNCIYSILLLLLDVLTGNSVSNIIFSLVVGFISGAMAVFMVDGEGSRVKVLFMGALISIPAIFCTLVVELSTNYIALLYSLLFALGSGVLADALMMIILPFFELVFGALTNFRLAELTDHKAKLIKELSQKAPGTFSHTIILAMLAEACGNAIGVNPLLARACAYYHDVGKLKQPGYFTENQTGKNPHDELMPELSTDIIRAHARDGAALIRKRRLPEALASAAEQHHGTLPIRYFYMKASKFTDGALSLENFCYYGPKPQTKVNAIIMICDACEAKVRTISNRTHENVDKAVKEIIEERMEMEQFTECDITLRELGIIRNTITNTLSGVYHERVKYPKLKTGGKRG